MLWIISNGQSCAITGCNIHSKNGVHQVWVERTGGKTLKIAESVDIEDVKVVKEAIDYAVKMGEKVLEI